MSKPFFRVVEAGMSSCTTCEQPHMWHTIEWDDEGETIQWSTHYPTHDMAQEVCDDLNWAYSLGRSYEHP